MNLDVKNLAFSYNNSEVLFENVNLSLKEGEIISILGANGAGKSTLLNCIANLLSPQKGEVLLNGQNIKQMDLRSVAKIIGYVPQTYSSAYSYCVRDFIVMGRAPYIGAFKQPKKYDFDCVEAVLEEMNISQLADRSFVELSGGERQQVAIARVLVQNPKIIMLDEPTNHLDYGNQLKMISLVHSLSKKGYGIIMTTHMPDHVILLDGKTGILDRDGHFHLDKTSSILTENTLQALYGVDLRVIHVDSLGRDVCIAGKVLEDNPESCGSL